MTPVRPELEARAMPGAGYGWAMPQGHIREPLKTWRWLYFAAVPTPTCRGCESASARLMHVLEPALDW